MIKELIFLLGSGYTIGFMKILTRSRWNPADYFSQCKCEAVQSKKAVGIYHMIKALNIHQ